MRSWCFDSQESGGVYDREYGSADIREVVHKIVGNGIFMDTDTSLQVAVDSGLQLAIQPGNCFINGAFGAVDAAESLTFDASASGRYDIVVARFDLSLSYRSIRLVVVKGTEGSSSAPTPTKTASIYDLQLAKVNIRSGATSILQTDITDTRTDSTVCGIVNGVSAQAAALQEQINTVSAAKQDKTNSLATETAIEDADSFPFYDASASAHKRSLWSNIKAKLKAYFDTFYTNASNITAGLLSTARGGTGTATVYSALTVNYNTTSCSAFDGIAKNFPYPGFSVISGKFTTKVTVNSGDLITLGTISGVSATKVTELASNLGNDGHTYISGNTIYLYAKATILMTSDVYVSGTII